MFVNSNGVMGPRVWSNYRVNFDDIGHGMLALIEIAGIKGWKVHMRAAIDSRGEGLQPKTHSSMWGAIFFILYTCVAAMLIIKLFIGVVKNFYSKSQDVGHLTSYQAVYYTQRITIQNTQPKVLPTATPNSWQWHLIRFMNQANVQLAFFFPYVALICVGCARSSSPGELPGQQQTEPNAAMAGRLLDIAVVVVAASEFLLQLLSLGPKGFVQVDGYQQRMALVVMLLLSGAVHLGGYETIPVMCTGLVFKLPRVFRILKLQGVQNMYEAVVGSYNAVASITALIALVLVIYGVLGVELFGGLKANKFLSWYTNFKDFPSALLVLFEIIGGCDWPQMMHESSLEPPFCTYLSDEVTDCGSRGFAYGYFLSYWMIMINLMLSLVLAVMIDSYNAHSLRTKWRVKMEQMEIFREAWATVDPTGLGLLSQGQLTELLSLVGYGELSTVTHFPCPLGEVHGVQRLIHFQEKGLQQGPNGVSNLLSQLKLEDLIEAEVSHTMKLTQENTTIHKLQHQPHSMTDTVSFHQVLHCLVKQYNVHLMETSEKQEYIQHVKQHLEQAMDARSTNQQLYMEQLRGHMVI